MYIVLEFNNFVKPGQLNQLFLVQDAEGEKDSILIFIVRHKDK